jgi:GNAT superfamily N-acetyltransferase
MQNIQIKRTDSTDPDFIELVRQLDAYLAKTDGEEHGFYHQFNQIQAIRHTVLIYDGERAIGCGAIKAFSDEAMEVKRMFVRPEDRQRGIASVVLQELERWAKEMGFGKTILETGRRMPDAIAFYRKHQYQEIPNYGQYIGVTNSICFEKTLE